MYRNYAKYKVVILIRYAVTSECFGVRTPAIYAAYASLYEVETEVGVVRFGNLGRVALLFLVAIVKVENGVVQCASSIRCE